MKKQVLFRAILVLTICGTLLSCEKKSSDPTVVRTAKYRKSLKEAYQKLGLFYQTNTIPGMTVAVSISNQLVWADGFGYSNYELKAKTSPSHKFRIGQISELITALTAAKLYEEGKLQIDRPVSEYLPEMNQKHLDYTIRQLGAHAAGIRQESVKAGKDSVNTLEQIVKSFIYDDLFFPPGTYYSHTELGIDLIAQIIEKSQGMNFTKAVKMTLTDTLNLTSTIPDVPFRIIENRSSHYDYDFIAQPMVAGQIDLRGKEASAGYLSSVIDLVKMGNAILYPGFLKQETINLLTTPFKLTNGQEISYSFGLIVSKDYKNRTFYGQRGGVSGGSATLLIYPEDKLVIAIASNIENNSQELPVFEIANIFLAQLHPEQYQENEDQPGLETGVPEGNQEVDHGSTKNE